MEGLGAGADDDQDADEADADRRPAVVARFFAKQGPRQRGDHQRHGEHQRTGDGKRQETHREEVGDRDAKERQSPRSTSSFQARGAKDPALQRGDQHKDQYHMHEIADEHDLR